MCLDESGTLNFLFLLETSLGHWKLIELAIDETVSVCVTEVVSPDLFYAVPVQTKGKKKNIYCSSISGKSLFQAS